MTLKKIFVLLFVMLFPALALANEPSQPSEEEFVQQESRVNILEGAADQKERVTVRGMSLREILIQRLREEHAQGLDTDIPESFIENLSDEAIEEIFRQANEEEDFDLGMIAVADAEDIKEEAKAAEENNSLLDFLRENKGRLAATAALALVGAGEIIRKEDEEELYGDSAAVTTGAVGLVVGDDFSGYTIENVKQAVWDFFKSEGFPEESIAGIMGNIEVESGFDTACVQGYPNEPYVYKANDGVGYGLIQWSEQSRKERLLNMFAIPMGKPVSNLNVQLACIKYELTKVPEYADLWERLKNCHDAFQSTYIWCQDFESPRVLHFDRRLENAYKYLSKYGTKHPK